MELSNRQIIDRQLSGMDSINNIHITNNKIVRNSMIDNGYYPEQFPAQENFKKLENELISVILMKNLFLLIDHHLLKL